MSVMIPHFASAVDLVVPIWTETLKNKADSLRLPSFSILIL